MRIQPHAKGRQRGLTLIECLVYTGLYLLLMGLAFSAFYTCFDNMKAAWRVTDDITGAVRAGELWREDVRAATGPIRLQASSGVLRIPHHRSEVLYKFEDSQVWRKGGPATGWASLLPRVERSQMEVDAREQVSAWRWELKIKSLRKSARVQPMFTFLAVPGTEREP